MCTYLLLYTLCSLPLVASSLPGYPLPFGKVLLLCTEYIFKAMFRNISAAGEFLLQTALFVREAR